MNFRLASASVRPPASGQAGFTMIEIALSLAIIGFALIAILGILPGASTVQDENRRDTIINQDQSVWMEALRNGAQGVEELPFYVECVTNFTTSYDDNGRLVRQEVWGFTRSNVTMAVDGGAPSVVATTNFIWHGGRIIGLLSTPRFQAGPSSGFISNSAIACVQAFSGTAADKQPQANADVLDLAFRYRLNVEVSPVQSGLSPAAGATDVGARQFRMLSANLHELRLTFRWPLRPDGTVGVHAPRRTYRTLASGLLLSNNIEGMPAYFFQSYRYAK